MYTTRSLSPITAFFCVLLVPALALAQDKKPNPEKAQHFSQFVEKARVSFEAEEYRQAIDSLTQANLVIPNPRLMLNIARSYEKLQDCSGALVYYNAYIRTGADAGLLQKAREEIDKLGMCPSYNKQNVGILTVTSNPTGAKIFIDNAPIGVTPYQGIGLREGTHKIRLESPGLATLEKEVDLKGEKDYSFDHKLEKPKKVVDVPPPGGGGEATPGLNIPAIALMGAGVVGLGVGAAFDFGVIPGIDARRAEFDRSSETYADLSSDRAGASTTALLGYSIGGLLLAGGIGWFLFEMPQESASKDALDDAVSILPSFGPHGWSLTLDARF